MRVKTHHGEEFSRDMEHWLAEAERDIPLSSAELEGDVDHEAHDHLLEAYAKVPSPIDLTELYLRKDGMLFGDVLTVLERRAKTEDIALTMDFSWEDLGKDDTERMSYLRGVLSFATGGKPNAETRTVQIRLSEEALTLIQKEEAAHGSAPHYIDSPIQFIVE